MLISGKCESTRSTSSLSSITSNTNEASATFPPFLHPPKLHPPPVHILAVLAQGMSVGVNTELIKKYSGSLVSRRKGTGQTENGQENERKTYTEMGV